MSEIATGTSQEVVLTALSHLKNAKIEDAIAHFAENFAFTDCGIGLEFKDKERLAEFFYKTRELYPDSFLRTDTILLSGDRVIIEWTLQFTLTEPFWGVRSRQARVSVRGASVIRTVNGKITDWADYYDGLKSRRTALGAHFEEWVEL